MFDRICIDPGHGLSARRWGVDDPGVVFADPDGVVHREADIVLRWARSLREALRAQSIATFLTREDPADHAPLGRRGFGAEQLGCDLMVSLHLAPLASGIAAVRHGRGAEAPLAVQVADALAGRLDYPIAIAVERARPILAGFDGPALRIELGDLADEEHREAMLAPASRAAACEALVTALLRPVVHRMPLRVAAAP